MKNKFAYKIKIFLFEGNLSENKALLSILLLLDQIVGKWNKLQCTRVFYQIYSHQILLALNIFTLTLQSTDNVYF